MKKGDRVVCINDSELPPEAHLIKGNYYTIKEALSGDLLLHETYNGEICGSPWFYGYKEARFRKLGKIKFKVRTNRKVEVED